MTTFLTPTDQVQALYVGYFGRAGDPAGANFWIGNLVNGANTLNQEAALFAGQPESIAKYPYLADPFVANPQLFITQVYQNLFNRPPEPAGLAFWSAKLELAKGSPQAVGQFILDVISGATGVDNLTIQNKVAVARDFTAQIANANIQWNATIQQESMELIAATTSNAATVDAAKAATTAFIASGEYTGITYSVAASAASIVEGQTETFTISTTGVDPSTKLAYTITGTGNAAGSTTSGEVTLDASGKAVVSVPTVQNGVAGDSGTLKLTLSNGKASSPTVTVNDVSTFTITASAPLIAEGQTETFTISTVGVAPGTKLAYTVTGTGNAAGSTTSGEVTLDASGKATVSVPTVQNGTAGDSGTLVMTLSNGKATSPTVFVSDTSTFAITASAASIVEGQTETFTITTAGIPAGTKLAYTVTGTGNAAGSTTSGEVTLDASGKATVSVPTVQNGTAGDSGTLVMTLSNGKATSPTVTVNDVSTFGIVPSASTINEGQTETFTIVTTGVAAGTKLAYTVTGTGNAAGQTGSGEVTLDVNGRAVVSVTVPVDATSGQDGTLVLALSNGLATSPTVTVNDSNDGSYTLTIGKDTLVGSDGDDIFYGPLSSNNLGETSNTLQPIDSMNGLGGTNSLVATVIPQATNIFLGVTPIDPSTDNVQNVFLTAVDSFNLIGGPVVIDAYRNATWNMDDVEQWWSVESNLNLVVTDATLNTAVGMDSTAQFVNYEVLFRPQSLDPLFDDAVTIVLNNVGNGEQGGTLTVGSTTPANANLAHRGIETFNVLMGNTSSFLTALAGTGNRLTTVTVAAAVAGLGAPGAPIGVADAATVLEIQDAFQDLTTFDAGGFVGQIGSAANRMLFHYNVAPPAVGSTFLGTAQISGGDGGNTIGVRIAANSALANLALTGGESGDDLSVDQLAPGPGTFGNMQIDAGEGANDVDVRNVNGNTVLVTAGAGADNVNVTDVQTTGSMFVDVGGGVNDVDILRATVGGSLLVTAGGGFDSVSVIDSAIGGQLGIFVGDGGSNILIDPTSVGSIVVNAGNDGGLGNVITLDQVTVGTTIDITTGNGFSDILVNNSTAGSDLTISIGNGNGVARNQIDVQDFDSSTGGLDGNLFITALSGNDDIVVDDTKIGNDTVIYAGDGNNTVSISDSDLGGLFNQVNVATGFGADDVWFRNVKTMGNVTITTGNGDDSFAILDSTFDSTFFSILSVQTGEGVGNVTLSSSTFETVEISTGNVNDLVVVDNVMYDPFQTFGIATFDGDDEIRFLSTNPNNLIADGGLGFDTFVINRDFATGAGDTPIVFTDIEKLLFTAGNTVDMSLLNAVSAGGGLVEEVWVSPELGTAATFINNLAVDLGQRVVVSNSLILGTGNQTGFVYGAIDAVGDRDTFPVMLTEGVTYYFNMLGTPTASGTLNDPLLRLYNPAGALVASDDDSGVGLNSFLTFTAPASGTYTIETARYLDSGTGSYLVNFTTNAIFSPNPTTVVAYGDINISTLIDDEADVRTLNVELNAVNEAVNGVGALDVTDNSIGAASVEVLRMTSTGVAGSRNVVQFLETIPGEIELLRIVGDRGLALHIADDQLLSSDNIIDIRANGTGLNAFTGDLQLVLEGSNLSQSGTHADQVRAGSGTNLLALYGVLNVTTDLPATAGAGESVITGFQTIQFGTNATGVMSQATGLGLGATHGAEGTFDAAGIAAGTVYNIVTTSGALTLSNIASTVNINANGVTNDDITLTSSNIGPSNPLNLSITGTPSGTWQNGWQDIFTVDFEVVNLQMAGGFWDFNLKLDAAVDQLVVTGGNEVGTLRLDTDIPTTVSQIDFSGYNGTFIGGFVGTQQNPGADVYFTVGSDSFEFALTDLNFIAGTPAENATATTFNLTIAQGTIANNANATLSLNFGLSGIYSVVLSGETYNNSSQMAADLTDEINAHSSYGGGTFAATSAGSVISVTYTPAVGPSGVVLSSPVNSLTQNSSVNSGSATTSNYNDGEPYLPATPDSYQALAQFNSIFEFTTDAEPGDTWTIDNFVAGGFTDASINNWTKLDFRDIGLTQDVGITAVVGDWEGTAAADGLIVTAAGYDFEIRLTGVMNASLLTNDNIIYAV